MADVFVIKPGAPIPYSNNISFLPNTGYVVTRNTPPIGTGINISTIQNKYDAKWRNTMPLPSGY